MELKHLRYFVAAVEEGSTQAAAQKVHVAQPALLRRIRDLEDRLGCQLLERSHRGVTPTVAGRALYRDAVSILDSVRVAGERAQRLGLEQSRQIRMGLVQASRKYCFLQLALAAHAGDHPASGVALVRGTSRDLAKALRERQVDATLLYEGHATVSGLGERLVHKERYVLAVHRANPLAAPGAIDLDALADVPLVWMFRRDTSDNYDPMLQHCRQNGLEPVIGQWANSSEELIDLVLVSQGACITPASSMLSAPGDQLMFRALPQFRMELDLTFAWRRDLHLPAYDAFVARMHHEIDQHQRDIMSESMQLDGIRLFHVGDADRPSLP